MEVRRQIRNNRLNRLIHPKQPPHRHLNRPLHRPLLLPNPSPPTFPSLTHTKLDLLGIPPRLPRKQQPPDQTRRELGQALFDVELLMFRFLDEGGEVLEVDALDGGRCAGPELEVEGDEAIGEGVGDCGVARGGGI